MMSVPGLALFYGGLVRTKNMLSVLTQVFAIVSFVGLLWVFYGYSLAFRSDDERSRPRPVLRRPRAHQEHALGADPGVRDRVDRGSPVGVLRLQPRLPI